MGSGTCTYHFKVLAVPQVSSHYLWSLSVDVEAPLLAGGPAAITDAGGERLGPIGVEAEVVYGVPQLAHVLVQPLPFLQERFEK